MVYVLESVLASSQVDPSAPMIHEVTVLASLVGSVLASALVTALMTVSVR